MNTNTNIEQMIRAIEAANAAGDKEATKVLTAKLYVSMLDATKAATNPDADADADADAIEAPTTNPDDDTTDATDATDASDETQDFFTGY